MEDGKHMLINSPEGAFTVPLLAKDNSYQISFSGYKRSYTASIERMFVYELYVNEKKGNVISWLREVDKFNVTPMVYDEFIRLFEQEHPKTFVDSYSWEEIPMQADDKYGLDLPIPFHCCTISRKHEEEIMQIIKTAGANTRKQVSDYFRRFCEEYGYDFSRKCKGKEFYWLYEAFLEQHGINMLYRPRVKTIEDIDENALEIAKTNQRLQFKAKSKMWTVFALLFLCIPAVWLYVDDSFWRFVSVHSNIRLIYSTPQYVIRAIVIGGCWAGAMVYLGIRNWKIEKKYPYNKELCRKEQSRNCGFISLFAPIIIYLAVMIVMFFIGKAIDDRDGNIFLSSFFTGAFFLMLAWLFLNPDEKKKFGGIDMLLKCVITLGLLMTVCGILT